MRSRWLTYRFFLCFELRYAAKGVIVPRSRKFCAIPFVGKDVPSPASEFSFPDIVIGLTILAYRYQVVPLARPSSLRTVSDS